MVRRICDVCGDRYVEENILIGPPYRKIHYITFLEDERDVLVCATCVGPYERGEMGAKAWKEGSAVTVVETVRMLP